MARRKSIFKNPFKNSSSAQGSGSNTEVDSESCHTNHAGNELLQEMMDLETAEQIIDDEKMESLREMMGPSLAQSILNLKIAPIIKPRNIFAILPEPHQIVAASKLEYLCGSSYEGGILGDRSGMGKIFSAIILIKISKREKYGGPWVIVTEKSRLSKWEREIQRVLKPDYKLNVLIMSKKPPPLHELSDYDVVLDTYDNIERGYSEAVQSREWSRLMGNVLEDRTPVTFGVYNKGIKFPMIFDQFQRMKSHHSEAFQALSCVRRTATIMISGSMFADPWTHTYMPISLLKGHALDSYTTFINFFGFHEIAQTQIKINQMILRDVKLENFMSSFTIVQSPEILELPWYNIQDVRFDLRDTCLSKSDRHFNQYMKMIAAQDHNQSPTTIRDQDALAPLVLAKQLSIHPQLRFVGFQPSVVEYLDLPDNCLIEKKTIFRVDVDVYRTNTDETKGYEIVKRAVTVSFLFYARDGYFVDIQVGEGMDSYRFNLNKDTKPNFLPSLWLIELNTPKGSILFKCVGPNAPIAFSNFRTIIKKVFDTKDIKTGVGVDLGKDVDKTVTGRKKSLSLSVENAFSKFRMMFQKKKDVNANANVDESVSDSGRRERQVIRQSSRMFALQALYIEMRHKYPQERIMITSESIATLDKIALMFSQVHVQCAYYDEGMTEETRDTNLKVFRETRPGAYVLLVSSACCVGLHIPEVSIIIQTEIWWSKDLELQMREVCSRIGQKHVVKIRRLIASNAAVDQYFLNQQDREDLIDFSLREALTVTFDGP